MSLYTRPQLLVLLIVVVVAGVGLAVGQWRRTHPELAARLEALDRAGESSTALPRAGPPSDGAARSPSEPLPGRPSAPPPPSREEPAPASASEPPAARGRPVRSAPPVPVDVNRATADELRALPGIGGVLAARIVAIRERDGPFASLDDLKRVPGLGRAKRERIAAAVALPP